MKQTFSLLLLSALSLPIAHGQSVIFQEDFDGDGTSSLDGEAPNIRPGTETWTAEINIPNDGFIGDLSEGAPEGSATVPLGTILQPNTTYEAVLDVNFAHNTTGGTFPPWFGLGFQTQTATPTNENNFADSNRNKGSGSYWFLLRSNGDVRAFEGPNTQNELVDSNDDGVNTFVNNGGDASIAATEFGSSVKLRTELAIGGTLSASTMTMFVETFQLDLDPADAAVDSIALDAGSLNHVGFSLPNNMPANSTDAFNQFTFSEVPEPSNYALLGGVLALAVVFGRRRIGRTS